MHFHRFICSQTLIFILVLGIQSLVLRDLQAEVPFKKGTTVLLYGASMIERLMEHGELEAYIHLAYPNHQVRFRSFAWPGDEVGHRLRAEGYADHMKSLLELWPADLVIVGYGNNEAFRGETGLTEFKVHYEEFLDQIKKRHPNAQLVLLSPTSVEPGSQVQNADTLNKQIRRYADTISDLARSRGALFIDLYQTSLVAYQSGARPFTINGLHLSNLGNRIVSKVIAGAMLGPGQIDSVDPLRLQEVALASSQLAHFVAETIRPKNGILYYGQRKRQEERDAEMPLYLQRIDKAERLVHDMAQSRGSRFADAPFISLAPPPIPASGGSTHSVGLVKSAADAQSEFKVAKGYSVNLFASDEQFPELRAPVQIAFDAKGRLWVVTMPSFPHTIPGQPQEDKIVILEDTNRDGTADKLTEFASGFDALDGIAFTHDGVLVSEQSRHWLMRDTNGDGKADVKLETLRGLDLTDSHHGGMIATDPTGGVWFSDGVFHRSQIETPHGVVRGVDSTTYRMNRLTGRVEPEWQSITPNPWKITFDRTGNVFQMYGDGLVLDGLALTWTPLGIYHPFAHAKILGYGKGSAAAVIASSNFPDAYQQGMASAACVGPYLVSITRMDFDTGLARGSDRLDLLSSTNAAFRPVDVEFGMDGALYVSDFSSAIIGHAQHPMRDARWNHVKGRVWRIVHSEKSIITSWPTIEGASEAALFELLSHQDSHDLTRKHARLELRKKGVKALASIRAWAGSVVNQDPQTLLEALFVLESFGEANQDSLRTLARSKSPLHRAAAIRLARYQADRLPNLHELLHEWAVDSHPRVQMEVIDAVAHLRPYRADVEHALHALKSPIGAAPRMLEDLKFGTQSARGRSIPVLEVHPQTRLNFWMWLGGRTNQEPVAMDLSLNTKNSSGPGLYRTFVKSETNQTVLLSTKHSFLDVTLNGEMILSHDSQWSSEQQVPMELKPGINLIEIDFRRMNKNPPATYLHNLLGGQLEFASLPASIAGLKESQNQWTAKNLSMGEAVVIRAAAGLQFSPKEFRVKSGSQVRLIFENPDLMVHNFVLVEQGAGPEIGGLADKLAADPNGMSKSYLPSSPKILQATPLVNPRSRFELRFTAPTKPGRYPYLCTFPGHWRLMQGTMIVEP